MSIELSSDGSYTLFSQEYQESYHSLRDGAINETMHKHIFPAFKYADFKQNIRVLDICFGLGYNSFFTLKHFLSQNFCSKLEIYSPEKDSKLLESLKHFTYPQEIKDIEGFDEILLCLIKNGKYQTPHFSLECFLGDGLNYIGQFEDEFFDVVYQDAFSPRKNPKLWSEEYFALLYKKMNKNGVVTTYSQSSFVKNNAKKAGFFVYEIEQESIRNSRIFSKKEINCKKLKQK